MKMEPFKIKSVEPLYFTTPEQRKQLLAEAHNNVFLLHANHVTIDMLTDSGTTAMSAQQWAGLMDGDEAYAGSRSFYKFETVLRNITGFKHIIPTHQGRAAERILCGIVGGSGRVIPNNTHFDTTRGNIEFSGAEAVDLPVAVGTQPEVRADFKGNMDVEALERFIAERGAKNIPVVMLTLTNNSGGGQPVSMQNIRDVRAICDKHNLPLFLDVCRFAENAMFIKMREPGYADKSVREIAQEIFSYADGATMSAKKDGMVNTGGFLAMNNDDWAAQAKTILIVTEGFPTYGGLARRDLEALARGLEEGLDEKYLEYRLGQVEYFGDQLKAAGVPILEPTGGHAVYLDARRFAPHIPPHEFPAQSVVCELYLEAGIRGVEIGSFMFGSEDASGTAHSALMELVRLAIPRRVYTQSHIDFCVEAISNVYKRRNQLRGYTITYQAPFLRHFTAHLEQV
ncbi:MAG: tryptophanase [Chlorobi bacterium]|nr:MAG: tryptophanase [Bacteroidota bacterium]KXK35236.1 MAG: tryptophanase [Chlorobi bacterium OLB6]MBL1160550.1 tryptophanase [Chlorobiota bacterium]MBW7853202.1 tryptophanase [Candidatus Kapabacteria bacterium]MCC6331309.1 tryptophanase [Ignavibacteria bacterium]